MGCGVRNGKNEQTPRWAARLLGQTNVVTDWKPILPSPLRARGFPDAIR